MNSKGKCQAAAWPPLAWLEGDLVELVFLRAHDLAVRDTPKAMLYGLTPVYVVGYLVILLLEWMR